MLGPRMEGLADAAESAVDGICITATGTVRWCVSLLTEASLGAPTPGASSVWSMSWSALNGAPGGCYAVGCVGSGSSFLFRVLVSVLGSAYGVMIW